jgi:Tfp pilus assembly protein PilN
MKKQDMNLLESYQRIHKVRESRSAAGRIYIYIFLGALLIASAYYFTLFVQNNTLKQSIVEVENYLNSPQVIARANEANLLNSDIRKLEEILKEVQNAQDIFDLQPKFSSQTMNLLLAERPGTLRLNTITFSGDAIALEVSGTRVYSVSDYVMRLRRLGVFQQVSYNGYDLENGLYNSNVVIVLKGGK